jgi:hypothetical protein
VLGFTREWERGTFFYHGEKKNSKDFQSCLPILPAYLPLKFPNGQFPLKIPGPISSTTLEQTKTKITRGGVYTWMGKGYFFERAKILRFPILSANPTCISSLEIS